MSRVPMGSDGAMLDGLNEKLRKRLYLVPQGISADLIATREGFTRDDVDRFALASQQKAARAIEGKRFANAMFAVKNDDGSVALDRDEHPRADTTLEGLGGPASRRSRRWARRRWARTARRSTSSRSSATPTPRRSITSTPAVTRRASSTAPRSC